MRLQRKLLCNIIIFQGINISIISLYSSMSNNNYQDLLIYILAFSGILLRIIGMILFKSLDPEQLSSIILSGYILFSFIIFELVSKFDIELLYKMLLVIYGTVYFYQSVFMVIQIDFDVQYERERPIVHSSLLNVNDVLLSIRTVKIKPQHVIGDDDGDGDDGDGDDGDGDDIVEEVCSICYEDLCIDKQIFRLSCGHMYHKYCMEQFLNYRRNIGRLENSQCPMCRNKIT